MEKLRYTREYMSQDLLLNTRLWLKNKHQSLAPPPPSQFKIIDEDGKEHDDIEEELGGGGEEVEIELGTENTVEATKPEEPVEPDWDQLYEDINNEIIERAPKKLKPLLIREKQVFSLAEKNKTEPSTLNLHEPWVALLWANALHKETSKKIEWSKSTLAKAVKKSPLFKTELKRIAGYLTQSNIAHPQTTIGWNKPMSWFFLRLTNKEKNIKPRINLDSYFYLLGGSGPVRSVLNHELGHACESTHMLPELKEWNDKIKDLQANKKKREAFELSVKLDYISQTGQIVEDHMANQYSLEVPTGYDNFEASGRIEYSICDATEEMERKGSSIDQLLDGTMGLPPQVQNEIKELKETLSQMNRVLNLVWFQNDGNGREWFPNEDTNWDKVLRGEKTETKNLRLYLQTRDVLLREIRIQQTPMQKARNIPITREQLVAAQNERQDAVREIFYQHLEPVVDKLLKLSPTPPQIKSNGSGQGKGEDGSPDRSDNPGEEQKPMSQKEMEEIQAQDGEEKTLEELGQEGPDQKKVEKVDSSNLQGGRSYAWMDIDPGGDILEYKTFVKKYSTEIKKCALELRTLQKKQITQRQRKKGKHELLPKSGIQTIDKKKHKAFKIKEATGETVELDDTKFFRKTVDADAPAEINIHIGIDGSGSMSYNEQFRRSMFASICTAEAANIINAENRKDAGRINCSIVVWGMPEPPVLFHSHQTLEEREKGCRIIQKLINDGHASCGTEYLGEAYLKALQLQADNPPKGRYNIGASHFITHTDGELFGCKDAITAIKSLQDKDSGCTVDLNFTNKEKNSLQTQLQNEELNEKRIKIHTCTDSQSIGETILRSIIVRIQSDKSLKTQPWMKQKKKIKESRKIITKALTEQGRDL